MKCGKKKLFSALALLLMLSLSSCSMGGDGRGADAQFPGTANEITTSSETPAETVSRESQAPSDLEETSSESGDVGVSVSAPTALEFLNAYLSMELTLYDTLILNMKEHSETFMDAVYLNDARRIRLTLESAVSLWEDEATGQGDTRTRDFIAGSTLKDGKPVQIENTYTARYEADEGRLVVEVTDNDKVIKRTECVKTGYGYIAQHYDLGDSYKGIPSIWVVISLRDADGMIGIETGIGTPDDLNGEVVFELPQTLRDWFVLEGQTIKVHSEQGAITEFEVTESRSAGGIVHG